MVIAALLYVDRSILLVGDMRETLAEIADPVARALAIAIERQRNEIERSEREAALREEIRSPRAMLDRVTTHLGLDDDALLPALPKSL